MAMTTTEHTTYEDVSAAPAGESRGAVGRLRGFTDRHAALTRFLVLFAIIAAVLLWKSHDLFSVPIHEDGDSAANAILIDDAKHFDLLVGAYSRQDFSHPGPAVFYLGAAGEAVFYDLTHIVPERYNANAIAILLLNAAVVALALTIVAAHVQSLLALGGCLAVTLAFASAHDMMLASTWTPMIHAPMFLLFLVAASSVATGTTSHLWCLALAGSVLVHGHVAFFLFVPLIAVVALVLLLVRTGDGVTHSLRKHRRDWIAFVSVVALFVLPIAVNFAVNYPGEFGKYWRYSTSHDAGGHSISDAARFVLWFWPNDRTGVHLLATIAALAAVVFAVRDRARPSFLRSSLVFAALASALLVVYAMRGIDNLADRYIGWFYWSAALVVLLVATIGALTSLRGHRVLSWVAAASIVIVFVLAVRGPGLENRYRGDPLLPAATEALTARARPEQPIALDIEDDATWPSAVGLLVEADRQGRRACLSDRHWTFMVTRDFVCTPKELRDGARFQLRATKGDTSAVAAVLYAEASARPAPPRSP
jgi:hypothetical protein